MHNDIQRKKYMLLMGEVEDLEEEVEAYAKNQGLPEGVMDEDERIEEIEIMKNQLAAKKLELKRLSDGCGTGHIS